MKKNCSSQRMWEIFNVESATVTDILQYRASSVEVFFFFLHPHEIKAGSLMKVSFNSFEIEPRFLELESGQGNHAQKKVYPAGGRERAVKKSVWSWLSKKLHVDNRISLFSIDSYAV